MHTITLRPATPTDIPLLEHWDEQPHIIACDPNSDWRWQTELQRDPPWREQLIAECDGMPIGYIEIIDPAQEDEHYWGEVACDLRAIDIWIGEIDYIGKGHGTAMMQQALARCFSSDDVSTVLVDPLVTNEAAHGFYESLGFVRIERRMFDDDDCYVYALTRKTWEQRQR